jgi:hypothetical protein
MAYIYPAAASAQSALWRFGSCENLQRPRVKHHASGICLDLEQARTDWSRLNLTFQVIKKLIERRRLIQVNLLIPDAAHSLASLSTRFTHPLLLVAVQKEKYETELYTGADGYPANLVWHQQKWWETHQCVRAWNPVAIWHKLHVLRSAVFSYLSACTVIEAMVCRR